MGTHVHPLRKYYAFFCLTISLLVIMKPHHWVIPHYVYYVTISTMILLGIIVVVQTATRKEIIKKLVPRFIWLMIFFLLGYLFLKLYYSYI